MFGCCEFQAFVEIGLHLLNLVHSKESFKVAKVCQIWEHVFQMPNVALDARGSDRFLSWVSHTLQHSDDLIYMDILNCITFSVILKEIKQSKVSLVSRFFITFLILKLFRSQLLESILQPTGLLVRRLKQSMEITTEKLSSLQLCPVSRRKGLDIGTARPGQSLHQTVLRLPGKSVLICFQ